MFYVTMIIAALAMDLCFTGLGWIPDHAGDARAHLTHFAQNDTFWLNLLFGALAASWFRLARKNPMSREHGMHGDHAEPAH